MKIKIEGFSIDQRDSVAFAAALRFYRTDQSVVSANGKRVPKPGAWLLAEEVILEARGHSLVMPDVELEATAEAGMEGLQFYMSVHVDREGRETWHDGEEFILPAGLGPRIEFAKVLLWNLERRGVIAPGQLDA